MGDIIAECYRHTRHEISNLGLYCADKKVVLKRCLVLPESHSLLKAVPKVASSVRSIPESVSSIIATKKVIGIYMAYWLTYLALILVKKNVSNVAYIEVKIPKMC